MKPWVVIPTYNERENIEAIITQLFKLDVKDLTVLVVDDNSPDGTAQIVRDLQKQYSNLKIEVRQKKEGLGPAYIHGFTYALEHGAQAVIQMDADLSHDPADVPRLLKSLEHHDVVIGSRYANGISVVNWPLRRLILSISGNKYARVITGIPFKDATGGFRAWNAKTLRLINLKTVSADGYGFQVVCLYRAWKGGAKIREIPIIFTERREGQSKMSNQIIMEASWLVLKLRFAKHDKGT